MTPQVRRKIIPALSQNLFFMVNDMPIIGKAVPYTDTTNQGVSDPSNPYYSGPTGLGGYNLDKAYGLKGSRPNEAERLAQENNKELYRNIDSKLEGLPKRRTKREASDV
ncbi:hypothetical protein ACV22V_32155 [Burkholderia sp. AW33-5]